MADGDTVKEAVANLDDARYEYILSLLEDDLEVPTPLPLSSTSETSFGVTGNVTNIMTYSNVAADEMREEELNPVVDIRSEWQPADSGS